MGKPLTTDQQRTAYFSDLANGISKDRALERHKARIAAAVSDGEPLKAPPAKLVEKVKSKAVAIPDDWEKLHWKNQAELAVLITGGKGPLAPAKGLTVSKTAKAIIKAELEKRSA